MSQFYFSGLSVLVAATEKTSDFSGMTPIENEIENEITVTFQWPLNCGFSGLTTETSH